VSDRPRMFLDIPLAGGRRRDDRDTAHHVIQFGVAFFGMLGGWLMASTGEWQRWGFVLGLLGQPFWIAAAWRAGQWGGLIVSIGFTGAWLAGIAYRF